MTADAYSTVLFQMADVYFSQCSDTQNSDPENIKCHHLTESTANPYIVSNSNAQSMLIYDLQNAACIQAHVSNYSCFSGYVCSSFTTLLLSSSFRKEKY